MQLELSNDFRTDDIAEESKFKGQIVQLIEHFFVKTPVYFSLV